MIKMILFDLDDTLLNSNKSVSMRTLSAIKRAHNLGIKIGYNTARTLWSARDILDNLPLDAVSYCSGARIYCEGNLVFETAVSGQTGKSIIDAFCKKFPDRGYFSVFAPYSYVRGGNMWKDGVSCDEDIIDVNGKLEYQRIVLFNTLREDICEFANNDLKYVVSRYGGLAITSPNVNKGHAAHVMGEHFDIKMSDIAGFGDDRSDLPMIRDCGTGVAMGNAIYEVKSTADYITKTNDNDGVAVWIEKHIHTVK